MDLLVAIKQYTTEGPLPDGLPDTAAPWFINRGFKLTKEHGTYTVGSGFNNFGDLQTRRLFYLPLEILPQVLDDKHLSLSGYLRHVILWRLEHGI